MAHLHNVIDSDAHFVIDPITRKIKNLSKKNNLIQFDHNSERFSFELNRLVDGHDMMSTDKIEIHYINISANRNEQSEDVYLVDDLSLVKYTEDTVVFSWLLSANATKYAGTLNFLIRFVCLDGEKVEYSWNTSIFSDITIENSMSNSEAVIAEYSDVLEAWRKQLFEAFTGHTENKENPHAVTATQVGLGNVPNVATNDQTPTYTESTTLAKLTSGEKLSVAFGKIAKAITDLISHLANKSNPHGVTASQAGAVPTTRKVNNKNLSADISLTASDVGAATTSDFTAHTGNKSNPHGVTAAQTGAVPTTRKVNNKALSADITLSASDVGAMPSTEGVVKYTAQTLTDAQKAQARANIGAGASGFSGSYNDLTNKPDIPDALSDLTEDTTHRTVTDAEKTAWNAKAPAHTYGKEDIEAGSASTEPNGTLHLVIE